MNTVALASLYLDRDETLETAFESVTRMAKQHPSEYYFDILCRIDQVAEAGIYLGLIYDQIRLANPQLIDEAIVIGLTTNKDIRPAAMTLALRMKDDKAMRFMDLNPKRKPR